MVKLKNGCDKMEKTEINEKNKPVITEEKSQIKNPICIEILKQIDDNNGAIDKKELYKKFNVHVVASLTTGKQPKTYLDKNKYHISKIGLTYLTSQSIPVKTDINTLKDYTKDKPKTDHKNQIDFIETDKEISKIKYAIDNRKNVMVKGATGCGKSYLIEQLAKLYDKELITISCDINLEKEELIGHYELMEGKTVWVDGIVLYALKNGHWLVFDEINMARDNILSVLNSLLDFRRKMTVKEHNNEEVKPHKDFRVFATYNPNYSGTRELNIAFRDRLNHSIELNYLPKEKEKQLITQRTGLTDKVILDKIVSIADDSRIMFKEGKISNCISTRRLLEFSEMYLTKKFSIMDCIEFTFDISDDKSELDDIKNIVKNYFVDCDKKPEVEKNASE